jgi:hypothetical protein
MIEASARCHYFPTLIFVYVKLVKFSELNVGCKFGDGENNIISTGPVKRNYRLSKPRPCTVRYCPPPKDPYMIDNIVWWRTFWNRKHIERESTYTQGYHASNMYILLTIMHTQGYTYPRYVYPTHTYPKYAYPRYIYPGYTYPIYTYPDYVYIHIFYILKIYMPKKHHT